MPRATYPAYGRPPRALPVRKQERKYNPVRLVVPCELFMAGSHLITFDRTVIPKEKIMRWFVAPDKKDEEYASGFDDSSFLLERPESLKVILSMRP